MTLSRKILILALVGACLAFTAWLVHRELRTPQDQSQVINRMIELLREGRYDRAARVGQTWMNDPRRDVSHDGLLYQQIAMVYMAKAYKKPTARSEALRQAELNLENQLDLYNKENVTSLRLDLFEIAGAHEVLGDLSDKDKCLYYGLARQELHRQSSLIHGDFYEADGKKFSLDPVRRDVNKHRNAVKAKSSKAGCTNADKNG